MFIRILGRLISFLLLQSFFPFHSLFLVVYLVQAKGKSATFSHFLLLSSSSSVYLNSKAVSFFFINFCLSSCLLSERNEVELLKNFANGSNREFFYCAKTMDDRRVCSILQIK